MKTKITVFCLAALFSFIGVNEQAQAKGGADGFFVGALGTFLRIKADTGNNHFGAGARVGFGKGMLGVNADFTYLFKKVNVTVIQPKLSVNLRFGGGKINPYIGGHLALNMLRSSLVANQSKLGFGGQAGAHIMMASNVSLFVEGIFAIWMKAANFATKKFTVFGGAGGVALHF